MSELSNMMSWLATSCGGGGVNVGETISSAVPYSGLATESWLTWWDRIFQYIDHITGSGRVGSFTKTYWLLPLRAKLMAPLGGQVQNDPTGLWISNLAAQVVTGFPKFGPGVTLSPAQGGGAGTTGTGSIQGRNRALCMVMLEGSYGRVRGYGLFTAWEAIDFLYRCSRVSSLTRADLFPMGTTGNLVMNPNPSWFAQLTTDRAFEQTYRHTMTFPATMNPTFYTMVGTAEGAYNAIAGVREVPPGTQPPGTQPPGGGTPDLPPSYPDQPPGPPGGFMGVLKSVPTLVWIIGAVAIVGGGVLLARRRRR